MQLSLYQRGILLCSDILGVIAIALLCSSVIVVFWGAGVAWMYIFLSLGALLFGVCWRIRWGMLAGFFCIVCGIGVGWMMEKSDLSWTSLYEGQEYAGTVRVTGDAVMEKNTQRIPIRFETCWEEKCFEREAFIRTDPWESYEVGERVKVSCEWEVPKYDEETKTDWLRIFSARGPVLFCYDRNVERTGEYEEDWRSVLAFTRHALELQVARILPYPESALASGLLFGGTSHFSEEWEERFADTSMTHIVAVSGYNVTLLVQYLGIVAIGLGFRRQRAWLVSVLGIFCFIALIGFPASGVRAGIMGVLALIALRGGSAGNGIRALLLASSVMLLYEPLLIRYDVGFQLSVLATLGIILGAPFFTKLGIQQWPVLPRIFGEIALTTFFAQIFVIPILLYTFGSFSFLSFLANLLVLWNLPLAMLGTLVALFASMANVVMGEIMGVFAWAVLTYDLFIIRFLSDSLSLGVAPDSVPIWIILAYYAVLFGFFSWYAVCDRKRLASVCILYEK